jgi:peptidoglycan/xylan/chitin deacetylase (PgdA/CDA1 family)
MIEKHSFDQPWKAGLASMLGTRILARAVTRVRGRKRALVLLYHRVRPQGPQPHDVVPTVSVGLLRAQLEAIRGFAQIVPLDEIVGDDFAGGRRIAVAFDDDYAHHVRHALPVLRELGVPATFFLCGRAVNGLGAYWWDALEARVAAEGVQATARFLDLPAGGLEELTLACEADPERQRRLEDLGVAPDHLDTQGVGTLAEAGMTVGFHTLRHQVLPNLGDPELEHALVEGRSALAEIASAPMAFFAYPHGKADLRTARAVRSAGYAAAFTGAPAAIDRSDDPFLLNRWEPGNIKASHVTAKAVARLARRHGSVRP